RSSESSGADNGSRVNREVPARIYEGLRLKHRGLLSWLCLPVQYTPEPSVTPKEHVGIDLGLKDTAVTSEGERLESGRFFRGVEGKIAQAQRRGHRRQAKRLHRKAARRRADALHKFSRQIVNQYQFIVVGDVSSQKLVKTRMAKSVLDAGWGML